jgi:spermidine synthase
MSLLDIFKKKEAEGTEDESAFSVEDRGYERVLKYGSITYSKLKGESVYTGEYWDYFLPAACISRNRSALLIGLGGGTVAFQLSALFVDALSLDVVELSKRVIEMARKFAPKMKANIVAGEGAAYVATTNKRYGAMLLDAYVSSKIPEQFLQRKFIEDAHRVLSEDGVLAVNYAMSMMGALRYRDYVSKLKERFIVFKVSAAMFEGNVIILCSKRLGKDELLDRIEANMPKSRESEPVLRNYYNMMPL